MGEQIQSFYGSSNRILWRHLLEELSPYETVDYESFHCAIFFCVGLWEDWGCSLEIGPPGHHVLDLTFSHNFFGFGHFDHSGWLVSIKRYEANHTGNTSSVVMAHFLKFHLPLLWQHSDSNRLTTVFTDLFTIRFCIWSKGAIDKLDALYGTGKKPSSEKKHFK